MNSKLIQKISLLFNRYLIYLILILGFIIRVKRILLNLTFPFSPDEHRHMGWALNMLFNYDLNPHWFGSPGSFVMYTLLIVYFVYFVVLVSSGNVHSLNDFSLLYQNDPTMFYLIGRSLIILFGIITIYFVYLIAKKLFNKPAALLASFCLAIAPLHIIRSVLIRTTAASVMLIMISIYFLLKFFENNTNKKLLIFSSLFAGFSIACKYPSGAVIFPILIYCLVIDYRQRKLFTPLDNKHLTGFGAKYFISSVKLKTNLSIALLYIFLGFFIFAPFAILDYRTSIEDIIPEFTKSQVGHERLPGIQTHLWYLKTALCQGIGGLFFEIFAGLGLIYIIWKKSYKQYLFLIFPILYFLGLGCANRRWEYFALPVLPFEAILFGVGFYYTYKFIVQRKIFSNFKYLFLALFIVMLIFASKTPLTRMLKIKAEVDTRAIAAEWIVNNLPKGSTIAYDYHMRLEMALKSSDYNFAFRGVIINNPASFYINKSVDYIIAVKREGYFKYPIKYREQISRYEELDDNFELIKTFETKEGIKGLKILVYKVK